MAKGSPSAALTIVPNRVKRRYLSFMCPGLSYDHAD